MAEYLSPGVYVEEVDRGPKPIEGVGTAMAAFIGFSEKAELERQVDGETITEDLLGKPHLVSNWTQYRERFGGFIEGAYMPHAVYGYFNNGGSRCYVISIRTIGKARAALLGTNKNSPLSVSAKQSGFGGTNLRISAGPSASSQQTEGDPDAEENAAPVQAPDGDDVQEPGAASKAPEGECSPKVAQRSPPFTVKVERKGISGAWLEAETLQDVTLVEKEVKGTKKVEVQFKNDRQPKWIDLEVSGIDVPLASIVPTVQEKPLVLEKSQSMALGTAKFVGDVKDRSGIGGLEALNDVTILCVPDLMSKPLDGSLDEAAIKSVQTAMIAHCQKMGDRVAILDAPPDMMPQEIGKWRMDTAGYDSHSAALYYPWIEVQDPVTDRPIKIPPCGHIAGIWARNDNTRGVHKAPGNEVVLGATGLAYEVTKGEQDTLNPNGVNCIRSFPGRGIRVWGARTLSSDPAWRYINVRRLFNYVEKSIQIGTQWVVFEPNDPDLWARVRRDISSFLSTVWASGALFGTTPSQAFYVKCDAELNPPESRDLGRLIVEVGLCPVKPAEFVIFRISQWAGPAA